MFSEDEALKSFKDISLMKQPTPLDQYDAAMTIHHVLDDPGYMSPQDMSMVDLGPKALGIKANPVRMLLRQQVNQIEADQNEVARPQGKCRVF